MAIGYNIKELETNIFGYVGPWSTSDSNPITIKIDPQKTTSTTGPLSSDQAGDGNDINIFLATTSDFLDYSGTTFNFYGIRKLIMFNVYLTSYNMCHTR